MMDFDKKIEAAVDYYNKSYSDRLTKLIRVVTDKLEQELSAHDIPARVAARVKNPLSLQGKLEKWAEDAEKKLRISSPQETLEHISDLAAVRVMTYTESDRSKVVKLVSEILQSPPNVENFDLEKKEEDTRIKLDSKNHYRATHMQICLLDDQLTGNLKNLKNDQCELQITSMLAHVWNEIEHDTIYKAKSGDLSNAERRAIDSLGLLTKTGDNIIESLLYSREMREEKEKSDSILRNEKFSEEGEMSSFLNSHFGDKVAGEKIDFSIGNSELLNTLQILEWDHPIEIRAHFSPQHMNTAKRVARKIQRFQQKADKARSAYRPNTCDLFLVAAFVSSENLLAEAFKWLHSNKREVALFNAYKEIS